MILRWLLLCLLAGVNAQVDFDTKPECVDGVQIITIAGTGQKGYGTIGGLTDDVMDLVPNSAKVALEYPASTRPSYAISVFQGVQNLTKYIQYFVDGCPNSKVVLLSFSQGAHVSLTTLCGWNQLVSDFLDQTAISASYSKNVIAVAAYGDPTHVYPEDYDYGTSQNNGIFPRTGQCEGFDRTRIASWCDRGDQFCDACPIPASTLVPNPRGCNKTVHGSYWKNYNQDVVSFVRDRYNAVADTPLPTSTSTSSSTTTRASSTTSSQSSTSRRTSSRTSTRSSTLGSTSSSRVSTSSRAVSSSSSTLPSSTMTDIPATSTPTDTPSDNAGTRPRPFFGVLDALRR